MLQTRFIPHSVNLNTKAGVSAWINQIESVGPTRGVTLIEESGGSAVDREFVAEKDVQPTMSFSTSDLAFLQTCGFDGVAIVPDLNKPGLTAWGRELPLDAVPTAIATTNHLKLQVSDGLLVPMSMRAGHNSVARLELMLHAILGSDATYSLTAPMVATADTAIVSGAGQTANIYTAGVFKFTISGGASRLVQGIREIAVDFGIQVIKESDSGDVYPTFVSILSRASRIEFTTLDVELAATIGDGVAVSAAVAYFRKLTANGQRVAPATTQHVSVAGTAGIIYPGGLSLGHRRPGEMSFTYVPVLNTSLVTISTSAAIPTS